MGSQGLTLLLRQVLRLLFPLQFPEIVRKKHEVLQVLF
jgi:hypothetical protein